MAFQTLTNIAVRNVDTTIDVISKGAGDHAADEVIVTSTLQLLGDIDASGEAVLLILGVAYALLAALYLAVQFLLGLHHVHFALVLIVAAAVLPLVLLGANDLSDFAWRVLAVHAGAAVTVIAGALIRRPTPAA